MNMSNLRANYHKVLCAEVLGMRNGVVNIADRDSAKSVGIAAGIVSRIKYPLSATTSGGQQAGASFERITRDYLDNAFKLLQHLRPGTWRFSVHGEITDYEQYAHLADLDRVLTAYPELKAALGDYLIKPDILVSRTPISDDEINAKGNSVNSAVAQFSPLRQSNNELPILHASISCKWTIRSDRSQNARTEGLNLIRNRKGNTPHIAIVTAEPLPSRISSVALGTGDVDCVYHFALH